MLPSLIRTYVPLVVGVIASWLLSFGIEIDSETRTLLVSAVGGLIAAGYYALARVLERKFPGATWMLGSAVQPTRYAPAAALPVAVVDSPTSLRTYPPNGAMVQDLVADVPANLLPADELQARLRHPAGKVMPQPRQHPDYPA